MSFTESPAKASLCCEDAQEGAPLTYAMYEALKDSCQNNATYFQPDDSENGQRLCQGFMTLMDHIDTVWPLVNYVRKSAPHYDFDAQSPGNGYRSFVSVVDSCVLHGLKISRQVCKGRHKLIFRKGYFTKEVESCGQLLASLGTCLHLLHTLLSWAPHGDLFPTETHSPEELFSKTEPINQYCFYGRCLGFHCQPSMRYILKVISISMAWHSEAYNRNLISSIWTGGKYLINPEKRAMKIVNISQSASVEFCKAFWSLSENKMMNCVSSILPPKVAVNKLIKIPPEPITVTTKEGKDITVLPPTVHIGLQSLKVRLISVNKRAGMTSKRPSNLPPSDGIVFHCHGGGFVAQTSKSHETYLREWATKLNVPILSVDYSLAPEAPFPRALEEVFYAYCWMINHFKEIGTTGKRIVFAGDSAGANLVASCTLKILSNDLRVPEGLFIAYAPLSVSFIPSPARLLCVMDPLLSFGFMMRCLKAYSNPKSRPKDNDDKATSTAAAGPAIAESNATSPLDSNGFLKVSPSQGVAPKDDISQKYVSDYLDPYVDSDTDSEGRRTLISKANMKAGEDTLSHSNGESDDSSILDCESWRKSASPLILEDQDDKENKKIKSRFSETATGIMGAMSSRLTNITRSNTISSPTQKELAVRTNLDALIARSQSDEFIFSVQHDAYLSPYWAEDELLSRFPPVRILTVHLDPFLDDCVMFAKKLKKLGNVVGIDVLEGLLHGFLNFSLMSKEAKEGSQLCVERIKQLMDLENESLTNENNPL